MADDPSPRPVDARLAAMFGEVPSPPAIMKLLDADVVDIGEGTATFGMRAGTRFHNQMHVMQGSVLSSLAELASGLALSTTLGEAEIFTIPSMHSTFLAPVVSGRVEATAKVARRGRTISYVDVEVRRADSGRLVTRAMTTCYHRRFVDDGRAEAFPWGKGKGWGDRVDIADR